MMRDKRRENDIITERRQKIKKLQSLLCIHLLERRVRDVVSILIFVCFIFFAHAAQKVQRFDPFCPWWWRHLDRHSGQICRRSRPRWAFSHFEGIVDATFFHALMQLIVVSIFQINADLVSMYRIGKPQRTFFSSNELTLSLNLVQIVKRYK